MKTKISLLAVLLISMSLWSCEDLLNKTIDLNAPLSYEYDFTIDQNNLIIEKQFDWDATTIPELQDYLTVIKGYTIKKISFQVMEFNGPDSCILNGELAYTLTASTTDEVFATITDVNLKTLFTNGTITELPLASDVKSKLEEQFLAGNNLSGTLHGTASEGPATVKIKFTVELTVKASPL